MDVNHDIEKREYVNLIHVNKPLYFKGLGVSELLIVCVSCLAGFMITLISTKSMILAFSGLGGAIIITSLIFKSVAKENNQGDPDNLTSKTSYSKFPKQVIDNEFILERIQDLPLPLRKKQ